MRYRRRPDAHWIKIGSNPVYVAVLDGRVEAVVYKTDALLGEDEGGEPAILDAGWSWFLATDTQSHGDLELDAWSEEERGSLDPEHDAALAAADEVISAALGWG